jgi:MFS transporter, putative metabolite:H+ symporter
MGRCEDTLATVIRAASQQKDKNNRWGEVVADNAVDIGWRLDRLNISRFHWRVLALIAAGMFFDSFDLYLASGVLGALAQSGESTLALNATFISATFLGMMIGAWCAGLLGDRLGRKFSYQFN